MFKPNTRCRNKYCTKGAGGTRALYYTCSYCVNTEAYLAVACSPECFDEYRIQIEESRVSKKPVNTLPDRIDMTPKQVAELINTPTEIVLQQTLEELSEFAEEIEQVGISGVISMINEELSRQPENEGIETEPVAEPVKRKNRKKPIDGE